MHYRADGGFKCRNGKGRIETGTEAAKLVLNVALLRA